MAKKNNSKFLIFTFAVCTLATIITATITVLFLAYTTPFITSYLHPPVVTAIQPAKISIERVSSDQIMIRNNGGAPDQPMLNQQMPFVIIINNKNVTDVRAINDSGLQLDISPNTGLGYSIGSQVMLSGPEVSSNGVDKPDILIIAHLNDGTEFPCWAGTK
ncbi:MAG TPA: hypothetical protein VK436_16265 [Methanocella sp.]|nr:hypothetical protein [Methanocella sp.]